MANRIMTTHVGSLIRPPQLMDLLHKVENKEPVDRGTFDKTLSAAVGEIVREQAEAGVDVVSDGEFGKGRNWAFYVHGRLSGMITRPLTPEEAKDPAATVGGGRDREAFPEYYAEADKATGLASRLGNRFVCNGPIKYVGHDELKRDIDNLKAAVAKVKVEGAFLPVVAPASALPNVKDEHYGDEKKLLFALADALRVEYKTIVDAGLHVQIDDAFFPFMQEKLCPPMTLAQYRSWAQLRIDALNRALDGIPLEKSRYHICWGSWSGPHVFDVPLKDIVDIMLQVNVGAYSFEAANVRHEHEWKVWKTAKLPAGKKILPGVISHATNVVEHPELVAERLVRFANLVGRENVMASSDCGFAQSPFARRVHPSIMWAKLRSMAEGARLAGDELWGRKAAA
jgi:5-methyltetrahydropteroyltriglutamate--homocysteine methyltransferase